MVAEAAERTSIHCALDLMTWFCLIVILAPMGRSIGVAKKLTLHIANLGPHRSCRTSHFRRTDEDQPSGHAGGTSPANAARAPAPRQRSSRRGSGRGCRLVAKGGHEITFSVVFGLTWRALSPFAHRRAAVDGSTEIRSVRLAPH
jgi:hypothetical protein